MLITLSFIMPQIVKKINFPAGVDALDYETLNLQNTTFYFDDNHSKLFDPNDYPEV